MVEIKDIRNEFIRRFSKLVKDGNFPPIANWFKEPFEEDTIIVNWISEDLKKVMRIQEADVDETIEFDGFIGKTGLHKEYDDLCIIAKETHKKTEDIFYIYKLWFSQEMDNNLINEEIEKLFYKYKKDERKTHKVN